MDEKEFIEISDFCRYYSIETSFIESLEDSGLIRIRRQDEQTMIAFDEMPRVERFIRMHYELEINLPGLETVDYLLQKVEALQEELRRIRG